jgi:hypothetical protein
MFSTQISHILVFNLHNVKDGHVVQVLPTFAFFVSCRNCARYEKLPRSRKRLDTKKKRGLWTKAEKRVGVANLFYFSLLIVLISTSNYLIRYPQEYHQLNGSIRGQREFEGGE